MSFEIIKADTAYSAAIATIGKRSFREAFAHLFISKEELLEYLEHTYDPIKITKSLRKENNIYFIALLHDVPVGFAKVKMNSLNAQIESISQMELQKIYVLPEYQGSGAGKALLNTVMKFANKICPDYLWLDTHILNEKAIMFYEKNGFKKTGKYFFTIGTQTFEYFMMSMPVALAELCHC